jgi:hypothetical protein
MLRARGREGVDRDEKVRRASGESARLHTVKMCEILVGNREKGERGDARL